MVKYPCQTEGLKCDECERTIDVGAQFAVATTPSKVSRVNCLQCAEERQAAGERGLRFE